MRQPIPFQTLPWLAALVLACMPQAAGRSPDARAGDDKEKQLQLRLVCASRLAEEQQVVLASCDADGKWRELGTAELRTSYITDWLPAQAGELHLALREGESLKSICRFTWPANTRRALVVLIDGPEKNTYEARVVDPEKAGFVIGSMLILNFSPHDGMVSLGAAEERIGAGKELVAKPTLDDNGMYRIQVSCLDDQEKPVTCFDRYFSGDPNLRKLLFLYEDAKRGLRVHSLPLFGSFD